jgi:hypothetical protein
MTRPMKRADTQGGGLKEALERARTEVARLERLAASASCREMGCDMRHYGGKNCGCDGGSCSVPVYVCGRCGDSDYGDNPDALQIRLECSAWVEG